MNFFLEEAVLGYRLLQKKINNRLIFFSGYDNLDTCIFQPFAIIFRNPRVCYHCFNFFQTADKHQTFACEFTAVGN